MKKIVGIIIVLVTLTGILAACQKAETNLPQESPISTEQTEVASEVETVQETEPASAEVEETTEAVADNTASLEAIKNLLGMNDEETADLLGGGTENWTEDKSFYIGRIYEISLYDENVRLFTTCNEDKTVASVSVWISDGEREVTSEEVDKWVERMNEFTGAEPTYDDVTSEAGSKNWKWIADGNSFTLGLLENILTISMQPMVGELK